jgi:hypothetical protein
MTLRTKPVGTVSVTKKPDGRLVLHYARPDGTAVFAPSQVREEESSTTPSTEGCTTFADVSLATKAAAQDGLQNQIELKPRIERVLVDQDIS